MVTPLSIASILKVNVVTLHVSAQHVMDLIVELRSDRVFGKDARTGHGQEVFELAIVEHLNPNTRDILVDIDV